MFNNSSLFLKLSFKESSILLQKMKNNRFAWKVLTDCDRVSSDNVIPPLIGKLDREKCQENRCQMGKKGMGNSVAHRMEDNFEWRFSTLPFFHHPSQCWLSSSYLFVLLFELLTRSSTPHSTLRARRSPLDNRFHSFIKDHREPRKQIASKNFQTEISVY